MKIRIPINESHLSPFFYVIRHKISRKLYAGVKYGKKSSRGKCDSTLFMTERGYHTSSKQVDALIEQDGLCSFEIDRIRHFTTAKKACDYEEKFLVKVNAAANANFINQSNGKTNFRQIGPLSEEHKSKISKANKGQVISAAQREQIRRARLGSKRSPEAIEKSRLAAIGRKQSDEVKEKHRQANLGKKHSTASKEKMRLARIRRGLNC